MIRNKFTLKQLEALTFVVDTGTFRRAAAALGTTQPNISARISALETALGDVLLFRDAGSVRLTEKGKVVLAQAREVLRGCETLLETAGRRDLIKERLRLGVTELVACTWLHEFLRALRRDYPALQIELDVHQANEIGRKLQAGELDLAILSDPPVTTSIQSVRLISNAYIWVASPAFTASLPAHPTLHDIVATSVITHARNTQAVNALEQACTAHNLPMERIVHSSSLSACVPMAIDGMGAALLPADLVPQEIARGTLCDLGSDWLPPPLDFVASYNADRAPNFVARAIELAQVIVGD